MAKQYKTATELNRAIQKIKETIIGRDEVSNEDIYMRSVTDTTVTQLYSSIINDKGYIKTYDEARADLEKKGQKFSYNDYQQTIRDLQDDEYIGYQLTYRGRLRFYKQDFIDKVFTYRDNEPLVDKSGKTFTRSKAEKMSTIDLFNLLTKVGNEINSNEKEISNYDSNTFYDLLVQEYYEMMK